MTTNKWIWMYVAMYAVYNVVCLAVCNASKKRYEHLAVGGYIGFVTISWVLIYFVVYFPLAQLLNSKEEFWVGSEVVTMIQISFLDIVTVQWCVTLIFLLLIGVYKFYWRIREHVDNLG